MTFIRFVGGTQIRPGEIQIGEEFGMSGFGG
jgi:hypothetical protein